MYTLPTPSRLKDHVLERWEAADRDPAWSRTARSTSSIVGGGPTGVETAGALAELYHANFNEDYPALPQDQARIDPGRGRPGAVLDVRAGAPRATRRRRSRSAASR